MNFRARVVLSWSIAAVSGVLCWAAVEKRRQSAPAFSRGLLPSRISGDQIGRIEISSPDNANSPCTLVRRSDGAWVLPQFGGLRALAVSVEDLVNLLAHAPVTQTIPAPAGHLARIGLDPARWDVWREAAQHSPTPQPRPLKISLFQSPAGDDAPVTLFVGNMPAVPPDALASSTSRFVLDPSQPDHVLAVNLPLGGASFRPLSWVNSALPPVKSLVSIEFSAPDSPLTPSFSAARPTELEEFSGLPGSLSADRLSKFEAAWANPKFLDVKPCPENFTPALSLVLATFDGFAWRAEFVPDPDSPDFLWMKLSREGNSPAARPALSTEFILSDRILFDGQFREYQARMPEFLALVNGRLFKVPRSFLPQ